MNRRNRKATPKLKPITIPPVTEPIPAMEPTVAEPLSVQDEYADVVRFPTKRYHDTLGEIVIPNAPRKGRQFECIEDLRAAGPGWKRSPWPIADKR